MKMHCYLRALTARKSLPHTHAHPNTNTTKHPSASLVLKTIKLTLSYCVRLSRSRLSAASARFGFPLVCGVSDVQIRWLGLRAFLTVLTRKQSSYPHTLMVGRLGSHGAVHTHICIHTRAQKKHMYWFTHMDRHMYAGTVHACARTAH